MLGTFLTRNAKIAFLVWQSTSLLIVTIALLDVSFTVFPSADRTVLFTMPDIECNLGSKVSAKTVH